MSDLTTEQEDILLHTIGLSNAHQESSRNFYVTDGPDADMAALVKLGLMVERDPPAFLPKGDRLFTATMQGQSVALAVLRARKPKVSRAKARAQDRYSRWLSVSDMWDISFGDFLRKRVYEVQRG